MGTTTTLIVFITSKYGKVFQDMQKQPSSILQSIYVDHLKEINGVYLTRREIELISFFISGRTTKKIANFFGISPKTVENHTHNIMVKLNCNSREAIIDFVEKSDKINDLRNYYSLLLSQDKFEESLKEIAGILSGHTHGFFVKFNIDSPFQSQLASFMDKDLRRAALKLTNKSPDVTVDLTKLSEDCLEVKCTCKGESEFETIMVDPKLLSLSVPHTYYMFIFQVLSLAIKDSSISEVQASLQSHLQVSGDNSDFSYNKLQPFSYAKEFTIFLSSKRAQVLAVLLLFVAAGVGYEFLLSKPLYTYLFQDAENKLGLNHIRSDLDIPHKSALLEHKQILREIDNKFSDVDGIQTVALIGIGGAGKTTLARRYAHMQNMPVISEINAQNHESLYESFVNLAKALAQTEEDEKKLSNILKLKGMNEIQSNLVQFVKQQLASRSQWFLIYDDVDKFSDIQKYFPVDPHNWGKGRIIITTQDSNIVNNRHIHKSVRMDELTQDEKLDLFLKIMNSDNVVPSQNADMEELKQFLAEIPPFPLDVSVAAYYIKATNISYKDYLQNMFKHNEDFSLIQEEILQQAGDYTKTRYGIINLSLDELTAIHTAFKDLLLFVSLLDSQNISRYLLTKVQDPSTVDNFIYRLKQYSLIQNDKSDSFSKEPKYSMHRSTQSIALTYMTNKFNLTQNKAIIRPLLEALVTYMSESIDNEDFSKMRDLYRHVEQVLTHTNLIEKPFLALLTGELGCIYYYLCNFVKAERLLQSSISMLNNSKHKNYGKFARYHVFLGNVHKRLGNYEQAKKLFDQSLALYKMAPDARIGKAKASGYLGVVYGILGEYSKAQSLLEESKKIYEQSSSNEIGLAWSLAHLASIYKHLGEYNKAKDLYKRSYSIYKAFAKDYVGTAWACIGLADVYMELGNNKKAKELFEESVAIYTKHFVDEHIYMARVLLYFGIYHRNMGDYAKARELMNKSLLSYQDTYGKEHYETGWVLLNIGSVHMREGDYAEAEKLLLQALSIFQKNKSPYERIALEELAGLYAKKSNKKKSSEYLIQALKSAEYFLPDGSPHIKRIKEKLKFSS